MTMNEFINKYKNQDMSEKSIEEMREIIIEFRDSEGAFNLSDAKSLNNRRLELQLFIFIDNIETDKEQINYEIYVKDLLRNGRNISDEELLKEFPDEYANFEKEDTLIVNAFHRIKSFFIIGGSFFNHDKTAIDEEKICKLININDYNYYYSGKCNINEYKYDCPNLKPYFAYLPELKNENEYKDYRDWLLEEAISKERSKNQKSKPQMETNSKENQEPAKIGLFFEILFFLGSVASIITSVVALSGIALTLILQPWIIFGIGVGLLTAGLITAYFVHSKKLNKSLNKLKQNRQVPQQQSEEQIQSKNPEVPKQQNQEVPKEKTEEISTGE